MKIAFGSGVLPTRIHNFSPNYTLARVLDDKKSYFSPHNWEIIRSDALSVGDLVLGLGRVRNIKPEA